MPCWSLLRPQSLAPAQRLLEGTRLTRMSRMIVHATTTQSWGVAEKTIATKKAIAFCAFVALHTESRPAIAPLTQSEAVDSTVSALRHDIATLALNRFAALVTDDIVAVFTPNGVSIRTRTSCLACGARKSACFCHFTGRTHLKQNGV